MEETMSTGYDRTAEEGGIKKKVGEFEDKVQHKVDELEAQLQHTRDRMHDFNETAVHFIQERPLAAIGIAFGAGYIIGKLASSRWLA